MQLYFEESNGHLDYKGKIRPKRRHEESNQFLTIQFEWMGQEKLVSSSLIGTSPEFEFALLTMLFLNGDEKTKVQLGPHQLDVTCYKMKWKGQMYIGTAFPEESQEEENRISSKKTYNKSYNKNTRVRG